MYARDSLIHILCTRRRMSARGESAHACARLSARERKAVDRGVSLITSEFSSAISSSGGSSCTRQSHNVHSHATLVITRSISGFICTHFMGIACIRDALTFDRNAHDLDVHTCVGSKKSPTIDTLISSIYTCEFL